MSKSIKQIAKETGLHANLLLKAARNLPSDALSQGFLSGDSHIADNYINQAIMQAEQGIEEISRQEEKKAATLNSLIVTSGYDVQGYKIVEYREFITTEAVFGMGIFRGARASFSDLTGAESETLNTKIQATRESALEKLKEKAISLGCNAIIGTDLDIAMFGDSLLGVVLNGTAVIIEPVK